MQTVFKETYIDICRPQMYSQKRSSNSDPSKDLLKQGIKSEKVEIHVQNVEFV